MVHEFRAMGTTVSVTAAHQDAAAATQRWFEDVERACSRFRRDSDLSRLNDDRRSRVPVQGVPAEVLRLAAHLRTLTDGLVDAGVGAAVAGWGYDRSFDAVHDLMDRSAVDVDDAHWDIDGGEIVRRPGVRLDLGGIAKGWAADEAVQSGRALIVSAGGDITSAHEDCVVEIRQPGGDAVAEIRLGVGALATSSVARRSWQVAGERVHHIIDPRTGAPARTPVSSATVVAQTAAEAEAGAKAVLIRGGDGLAWAAAQPWIDGALVVWNDGSVYATTGLEVAA